MTETGGQLPKSRSLTATAIPWSLLSVRVALAPVLIARSGTLTDRTTLWFYLLAFVTDYFDGVVARRFGTDTRLLRKADSTADTIFHLALAWLIVRRHPGEFQRNVVALVIYLASATVWYILDAIRWRRVAGFHAYSAKLFSIGLLIWMVTLFSGHATGYLLSVILIFGALSNIEGIYISLRLHEDRADVPSVFHLWREKPTQC